MIYLPIYHSRSHCLQIMTIVGSPFSVEIVDTAGNDEYSRLSRNATVGVHGYILVYSTASRASLEKLRNVNKMLFNMLGNPPGIPRVLVATMLDAAEQR